ADKEPWATGDDGDGNPTAGERGASSEVVSLGEKKLGALYEAVNGQQDPNWNQVVLEAQALAGDKQVGGSDAQEQVKVQAEPGPFSPPKGDQQTGQQERAKHQMHARVTDEHRQEIHRGVKTPSNRGFDVRRDAFKRRHALDLEKGDVQADEREGASGHDQESGLLAPGSSLREESEANRERQQLEYGDFLAQYCGQKGQHRQVPVSHPGVRYKAAKEKIDGEEVKELLLLVEAGVVTGIRQIRMNRKKKQGAKRDEPIPRQFPAQLPEQDRGGARRKDR